MQPDTITLDVNHDNDDGTTATIAKDFTRFDEYQNRSEYIADGHSLAARDKLGLYRTMPKPSGNYRGTAKSAFKLTKDQEVLGIDGSTIISPGILDLGTSFPVGMSTTAQLQMLMEASAMIQHAVMITLSNKLMV